MRKTSRQTGKERDLLAVAESHHKAKYQTGKQENRKTGKKHNQEQGYKIIAFLNVFFLLSCFPA
jgi:hypothetical protein